MIELRETIIRWTVFKKVLNFIEILILDSIRSRFPASPYPTLVVYAPSVRSRHVARIVDSQMHNRVRCKGGTHGWSRSQPMPDGWLMRPVTPRQRETTSRVTGQTARDRVEGQVDTILHFLPIYSRLTKCNPWQRSDKARLPWPFVASPQSLHRIK